MRIGKRESLSMNTKTAVLALVALGGAGYLFFRSKNANAATGGAVRGDANGFRLVRGRTYVIRLLIAGDEVDDQAIDNAVELLGTFDGVESVRHMSTTPEGFDVEVIRTAKTNQRIPRATEVDGVTTRVLSVTEANVDATDGPSGIRYLVVAGQRGAGGTLHSVYSAADNSFYFTFAELPDGQRSLLATNPDAGRTNVDQALEDLGFR
jgi:hypothetical protein